MEWSTACPDWAERLVAGRSIIPPPIYPDQAEQALAVFKALRVVDLPGRPTFGECSDQWVFDFVAAIFGAYDAETGNQLIREFYLLISKKNTKSTIAAGIMLTATILCWREGEEHLILAPTKEVADNSFIPAMKMVLADDDLGALFHVQPHIRTITHRVEPFASLKVIAADTETVAGTKSGRILVDEHWLFGKREKADGMFMEATGGQVSRNEGWVIYLSTQSDEAPAGVFAEKLQYHRDVRDGNIVDPRSLPILYEFPDAMVESKAFLDPANFYITNPNLGRSVNAEWIKDKLIQFAGKKDGTFQKFIAKHLNIQIGLSLSGQQWAGAAEWEQNARPVTTLEEILDRSDVVEVGIDGGGLDDLLGLVVLGRTPEGEWLAWCHAWAHPKALERNKQEVSKFKDFERDGDLTMVKNVGDDVIEVADIVERCELAGLLDRIGVDQAGIGAIVTAITDRGIDIARIIGIPQGWRLSGAIQTTERKLAAGKLKHSGSRLMAYCVSNGRSRKRGNATLVTKEDAGNAKIDPLAALFDAVALMSEDPKPRSRKYQVIFA